MFQALVKQQSMGETGSPISLWNLKNEVHQSPAKKGPLGAYMGDETLLERPIEPLFSPLQLD